MNLYSDLLWFDPGVTTGVCFLRFDARWLKRGTDPSYESLATCILKSEHWQVGRHARAWDGKRAFTPQASGLQDLQEVISRASHLSADTGSEIATIARCQNFLDDFPSAVWGTEDFILRIANKDREVLAPVRINATLAYAEMTYGVGRAPFYQSSSLANTTANDDRLRRAGLYRPGMIHANDAARHAATFLRRCKQDSKLRAQAWPNL